jgi:antitoxin (DNA-binding transcriptional repressor) of toxin-antitoxin stability system
MQDCRVDVVTASYLRDHWRECREAAAYDGKSFVVTYHEHTRVAVLLAPQIWRRGLARVPHEEHAELGVRDSRTALRRVITAARQGAHTLITLHGEENAVIAPYEWARQALPELIPTDHQEDADP